MVAVEIAKNKETVDNLIKREIVGCVVKPILFMVILCLFTFRL